MAINKIDTVTNIDLNVQASDWTKLVDLVNVNYLQAKEIYLNGNNIKSGSVFNILGTIYIADSDTAVSGTPSKYIKLTVSGALAVPSYVANLTGVAWNNTYNAYYDASNNLYLFNETEALHDALLLTAKTKYVESDDGSIKIKLNGLWIDSKDLAFSPTNILKSPIIVGDDTISMRIQGGACVDYNTGNYIVQKLSTPNQYSVQIRDKLTTVVLETLAFTDYRYGSLHVDRLTGNLIRTYTDISTGVSTVKVLDGLSLTVLSTIASMSASPQATIRDAVSDDNGNLITIQSKGNILYLLVHDGMTSTILRQQTIDSDLNPVSGLLTYDSINSRILVFHIKNATDNKIVIYNETDLSIIDTITFTGWQSNITIDNIFINKPTSIFFDFLGHLCFACDEKNITTTYYYASIRQLYNKLLYTS